MTLVEEFGIRAFDPILRDATALRAARAEAGKASRYRERIARERQRAMLSLLADGRGWGRQALFAELNLVGKPRCWENQFVGMRDAGLVERAGQAGRSNIIWWRITDAGQARLRKLGGVVTVPVSS